MHIDFTGAAELVESSAKVIKTFTESFRDSLKAGLETVDLVSARKAKNRLTDIHRKAVHIVARQGIMLMPAAEKYVKVPNSGNWKLVRSEIEQTLKMIEPLADDFMALRGDFIIEQTYLSLLNAMNLRQQALQQVLELIEPPTSEDEMNSFREFLKNYVVLVRELQELNLCIGKYLRERE